MKAYSAQILRIATSIAMMMTLLVPLASGQTEKPKGSAALEGTVCDAQNHPVAGASISLRNSDSEESLSAKTNPKGHFRFDAVRAGTYELHAKMAGYRDLDKRGIVLAENQDAAVDLILEKETTPQTQKSAGQPQMEYSDQPEFTVAGVTDPTNLGGHGSDVLVRTKDELAKETASLNRGAAENTKAESSDPI